VKELRQLQEKVDSFFNEVYKKHTNAFTCKVGCDKCCHVDLNIFTIEAQRILDWVDGLTAKNTKELLVKLNAHQIQGQNLELEQVAPCPFLVDSKCAIYPARAVICRSHGLALIRESEENKKVVDCCNLNFKDSLPPLADMLDQDRLNMMLASLQGLAQEQGLVSKTRISLKALKTMILNNNREL
jgi:uncharacterized protein